MNANRACEQAELRRIVADLAASVATINQRLPPLAIREAVITNENIVEVTEIVAPSAEGDNLDDIPPDAQPLGQAAAWLPGVCEQGQRALDADLAAFLRSTGESKSAQNDAGGGGPSTPSPDSGTLLQ